MKKMLMPVVSLICLFAANGCVAVAAKSTRIGTSREVVAVNGKVYVIDTNCGSAREVDLADAKPFVPPVEDADDEVEIVDE